MGSGVLVYMIFTDVNGPIAVTDTEEKAIRFIENNWEEAVPVDVHNMIAYQVSGVHPLSITAAPRPMY